MLCLIFLPVYGWMILLGWLIFQVSNPRLPADRKEIFWGLLLFLGLLVIASFVLAGAMMNNPDMMSQLLGQYGGT